MIDKYDTLQDKLGFDIRELNEYKYAQRLRNEVKMKETYVDAEIITDDLLDIKNKLKLAGWTGYTILGYMSGEETYKVKLKDTRVGKKPHITIISMEKEGRILHILEDLTKEV